jgi:uncharacterized protein YjbI with pentapeptide repeats
MPAVFTFQALRAAYQAGERDFVESDLDTDPDHDLSGMCLDGIDLSKSWVVASFRGASLRNAKFCAANIKTCDFTEADLTGADFSGAGLCAATFVGAKMDNARFEGAYYHSSEFKAGELPDF